MTAIDPAEYRREIRVLALVIALLPRRRWKQLTDRLAAVTADLEEANR